MKEFYSIRDIDLEVFSDLCAQEVNVYDYPSATGIEKKVIIYDGHQLSIASKSDHTRQLIQNELHHCLKNGPGVFVIRGFYPDTDIVDRSTLIFRDIIAEEKALGDHSGDHFAKAGENERIWNSFQKVCEKDPAAFIDYYKNPLYALVSEAWLGPGYQITAQVNIVKSGGQAQSAHRDFHLGFQSNETVARFPLSLQAASQYLTLQGGIAHTDMPPKTGPTLLLPYSQQYDLGYLAWRDPAFKRFFTEKAIQLPLYKGDAVFFSPALFHAAGTNTSPGDRIANLVQISAAFGRPMESIDRYKLMQLIYPILLSVIANGHIASDEVETIVAAIADGYSFPTNLDIVQPVGGAAPESAAQLMSRALREKWPVDLFNKETEKHVNDRKA